MKQRKKSSASLYILLLEHLKTMMPMVLSHIMSTIKVFIFWEKNLKGKFNKFACKRRYASDSDDPRIPSEYGVICFYFNPGEEYIYYIYLTDEEDYMNLDKDLFGVLNLRDELTKESVMINHVLHRIHDNKVW